MNQTTRIIIVVAVIVAAALAFLARPNKPAPPAAPAASTVTATAPATNVAARAPATAAARLPRLLDLGAGKCIPCKMMKPILEDLKASYADRFTTEFIDVWENRDAGKQYNVEMIPTQIFFDVDGNELFRHVGFYSKEDILAKWQELGVTLAGASSSESKPSNERTAP